MRHGVYITCALRALAAAVAFQSTVAMAQLPPAVSVYKDKTDLLLIECRLSFDVDLMRGSGNMGKLGEVQPLSACVAKARAAGKQQFDAVMKTIKKPAAQQALKGVHAAFLAALTGIDAFPQELKIRYDARQAGLREKLSQAWSTLEVEL